MILNKEQLDARITSEDNLIDRIGEAPKVTVIKHQGANGSRESSELGRNLTDEERITAGYLARTVGADIAASVVGCKESTAVNYAVGQIGGDKNPEFKSKLDSTVNKTLESIQEKAAEKLLASIGLISEEKMMNAKVSEVAAIASSMSKVVSNISNIGKNKEGSGARVSIVLMQPKQANEAHFDVIDVSI